MPKSIDLLYFEGCPNYTQALTMVQEVLRAEQLSLPITVIAVTSEDEARQLDFYGSPTIRIDGVDVAPVPVGSVPALACRLYRHADGRQTPIPPRGTIESSLRGAPGKR